VSELIRIRYVERVREATRALIEDLLESNRRLGLTISVLGQERDDASREDMSDLNKRSVRWRQEQESVLEMLGTIDRDYKRFEDQFHDVERQNANLATLYAAGHALHTNFSRDSVLAAIQEIVINLVGSEEFAIVAADEQLTPLASFGMNHDKLRGLTRGSGIIGRAYAEARTLALPHGMPTDATRVRVCIPLVLGERVDGFVLIFGFLPQKDDLSTLDHELFGLVGTQAAAALHVSGAVTAGSDNRAG
jgi:hypothetical protein